MHSTAIQLMLALATLAGSLCVWAGDAPSALEQHLRNLRPDVARWQVTEMPRGDAARNSAVIADVGRIAARTPVRFGDGSLRWYAVAGFREVPVSLVPLERGAAIDMQAIELAERDVIALGCERVELRDTVRWRTSRRLSAGDALCAHVVESAPEVQREQRVTLQVHRGDVSVSRVLTAASDARLGEHVRLRDRSTGATLLAIVTGPGEARVSQELR